MKAGNPSLRIHPNSLRWYVSVIVCDRLVHVVRQQKIDGTTHEFWIIS